MFYYLANGSSLELFVFSLYLFIFDSDVFIFIVQGGFFTGCVKNGKILTKKGKGTVRFGKRPDFTWICITLPY